MKLSSFLTFLAVANAKPQTSGDPVELVNQLLLSGPLADSEAAIIIDQALRYVSGELLPAIETMTSPTLNSTSKALAAMDLIMLTGERGARAVTSYAEKTTDFQIYNIKFFPKFFELRIFKSCFKPTH